MNTYTDMMRKVIGRTEPPTVADAVFVLPEVLELLWAAGIVLEFDPYSDPDEDGRAQVLAWVNVDERQVFVARAGVGLADPIMPDRPGASLALAATAILWTLIQHDVPIAESSDDRFDGLSVAEHTKIRKSAQARVRSMFRAKDGSR